MIRKKWRISVIILISALLTSGCISFLQVVLMSFNYKPDAQFISEGAGLGPPVEDYVAPKVVDSSNAIENVEKNLQKTDVKQQQVQETEYSGNLAPTQKAGQLIPSPVKTAAQPKNCNANADIAVEVVFEDETGNDLFRHCVSHLYVTNNSNEPVSLFVHLLTSTTLRDAEQGPHWVGPYTIEPGNKMTWHDVGTFYSAEGKSLGYIDTYEIVDKLSAVKKSCYKDLGEPDADYGEKSPRNVQYYCSP